MSQRLNINSFVRPRIGMLPGAVPRTSNMMIQAPPPPAFDWESGMAPAPVAPAAMLPPVAPRAVSPLEAIEQRIAQARGRDVSQDTNGRLGSMGRGALYASRQAGPQTTLGGTLGTLLGGLVAGGVMPNIDERLGQQDELKGLTDQWGQVYQMEKGRGDLEQQDVTTENLRLKPELERTKQDVIRARDEGRQAGVGETNRIRALVADNNALYQDEKIKLGRDVAGQLKENRDAIVELRWAGVDQGDERIRQRERAIDEIIRHNTSAEGTAARNATTAETRAGASASGGIIPPAKLRAASGVVARFREANERAGRATKSSDREKAGAEARALYKQIHEAYPDLYDTGLEGGSLTVTQRAGTLPPVAPRGGAAKPPMPQANLEAAISKKMNSGKYSTRAEAERYIRSQVEVVP